jgi:hypothetical protein
VIYDAYVSYEYLKEMQEEKEKSRTKKEETNLVSQKPQKAFLGDQRPFMPFLILGPPFFPIIIFLSTTLLTGMTGISLHVLWPITSQNRRQFSLF